MIARIYKIHWQKRLEYPKFSIRNSRSKANNPNYIYIHRYHSLNSLQASCSSASHVRLQHTSHSNVLQPTFSRPRFSSATHPTPGPHIAFVNFTILNIHVMLCFPFSYGSGWMAEKEKKRQKMCVDVKVFPSPIPSRLRMGFSCPSENGI